MRKGERVLLGLSGVYAGLGASVRAGHAAIYADLQRECKVHLSEHYGDSSPGTTIRIEMTGISMSHKELIEKKYKYARPCLENTPWESVECKINDPFGNKIVFCEF